MSNNSVVTKMRISILPKRVLGWWSVGLGVASIVFMELSEPIVSLNSPNFNKPLAVILLFILACIAGVASVTGLISIIKRKQGAILVFISTAIGLFFVVGGVVGAVQTMMGIS